ncbi:MAD3 protein, partial [Campylorhamphus procurvoides]|nr:MAD3 protein [Campylorhamphus procurvoides]
ATTSIQVLLQAAEFLELREHPHHSHPPRLTDAEHGYASLCPARSRRAVGSVRSVHNALEKHRYRGEGGGERRARGPCSWLAGSLQRLEEQELRAQRAKDRLRDRQRSLRRRLEWLLLPTDGERARANSLDSSQLSEPSEGEDAEIEVDGVVFSGDLLPSFGTGRDHSYSSLHSPES